MHAVRRTISSYLIVMTLVAMLSTAIGFAFLYRLSIHQEQEHLKSVAMTYGHLLENMASQGMDEKKMTDLLNSMPLALTATRQSQELVLARKEKEGMVFLYRQSEPTPTDRSFLSASDTILAGPMRHALDNQEGNFVGVDYSGVTVLSSAFPIMKGRWGLVAKIDLDQLSARDGASDVVQMSGIGMAYSSQVMLGLQFHVLGKATVNAGYRLQRKQGFDTRNYASNLRQNVSLGSDRIFEIGIAWGF